MFEGADERYLTGILGRCFSNTDQEITMRKTKKQGKSTMVARLQAEARATLSKRTEEQGRFLEAALAQGPDLEPIGRLAG
ncbi:hypothetical protein D3C84_810280 [compost metagenome]